MGVAIPQIVSATEDRASGALVIDGGLRFGGDTPQHYLTRTTSTPTNAKIFTFSCWFKKSLLDSNVRQFISNSNGANDRGTYIGIENNEFIAGVDDDAAGPINFRRTSTGLVRDASSWYHLVWIYDTTQSTTDAAIKIYLNGVRFDTTSAGSYSQNFESRLSQSGKTIYIGSGNRASSSYTGRHWNGFMSQVYFVDGQALDPSSFGYIDPLTNTWRPKKYSGTYGNNGFYLPLDGNTPIGQDQSGRGNNWTPVNFGGSNTIEKATGALPILNTDGGGKVARVGVRTDSNASSLVLALPLVGIKSDFSNAINSGTSNKAITAVGNAAASSTQSNFYGGSFYFDGTGDWLSIGTSSDLSIGTSDNFTFEAFIYPTAVSDTTPFGIGNNAGFAYRIISGSPYLYIGAVGGILNTGTISANKWTHVAVTRSGGTLYSFIDGVLVGSVANTSSFSGTQENFVGAANLTGAGSPGYTFTGYIQDVRFYKGAAKYTQNFIPASTDPDILPDTPSGVAYSSNVTAITDGAVAFDGSGDYLNIAATDEYSFGTGDFTIETFIYHNTLGGSGNVIIDFRDSPSNTDAGSLWKTSGGEFGWYVNGSNRVTGETVANNRWYHLALVRNSGTTSLYVNGRSVGSFSDSFNYATKSGRAFVGALSDGTGTLYLDGFISNLHIVKGTALYTSNFTPPTAPITSVANTKLLCCKSNSSATAADVTPGTITANGNASATNFNPFTVNINTVRGKQSGWCTWNPLDTAGSTLSNGNLNITTPSSGLGATRGTIGVSSGKWYYEHTITSGATSIGIMKLTDILVSGSGIIGASAGGYSYYSEGVAGGGYTKKINNGTQTDYGASFDPGDTISVAFDLDAGTITFYKNGISQGIAFSGLSGTFSAAISDGTNAGSIVGATNFGQKPFKFPPPTGFQPLALANTPRPTIVRPDQYVGVATYVGNQSSRTINCGFKPDFVWIKERGGAYHHALYDSVRGPLKSLSSSRNDIVEQTETEGLNLFAANGFSFAGGGPGFYYVNRTGADYVGWVWKAGGSGGGLSFWKDDIGYSTASAAGLTAGTITPTGASVNTKSGFSIIGYTGTNANATISHGLGNVPAFIIAKSRDTTSWNWIVYHKDIGVSDYLALESTQGSDTRFANIWGTGHTTSVFGVRTGYSNNPNGERMVAYCWAEIPGFSKFGSYTGNGSTDGPVVIIGFRPRWLLVKKLSATGNVRGWVLVDSERSKYNVSNLTLFPHAAATEDAGTYIAVDFLSNGFKLRSTEEAANQSYTYIYAAFAETPSFNLYGGQANAR